MEKGYMALVLHAHLPFVWHPQSEAYIEERWFFEAVTESYLPLLDAFEGLVRDQVDFRVTLSLTPPLLSMLAAPLLQERYAAYLDNLIELAEKETERTRGSAANRELAELYLHSFRRLKQRFVHDYQGNLISGFRKLRDAGCLELITSTATHAFLPYIRTEQALRAQIEHAIRLHVDLLEEYPQGIWLPECGFREGLDYILKDYGLRYFFSEAHGVLSADPKPRYGLYAPVLTPGGLAAFARDREASEQVWSSQHGYPGDFDYREYYRDIGYDLDYDYLKPHLHQSGLRLNTGIKYHRITGSNECKALYDPALAREKAAVHAGNFMFNRERQIEYLSKQMDRKPLVTVSFDAELFGHWWYEGPQWIDYLCRKIRFDQNTMKLVTPSQYLREFPVNQQCELQFTSWGRGGYGDVWLGPANEWLYRRLHRMEACMLEAAQRWPKPSRLQRRALNQMARELMLAESSDWAFIIEQGTMVEYAKQRSHTHIRNFHELFTMLLDGLVHETRLARIEQDGAIFPSMDYRVFRMDALPDSAGKQAEEQNTDKTKVLMLSWEYPPMIVGGLSKHVFDLSRHLVEKAIEVHVITCHVDGYPAYELNQGVHVHRMRTYQSREVDFMEWVLQLNLAMFDYGRALIGHYGPFHIVHAHDWLTGRAAKALKDACRLPLAATIHATEHGRNQGIFSDMQQRIHSQEWELTYEAGRVVVCSGYMEQEIRELFQLPADKLEVIPNGVDAGLFADRTGEAWPRGKYAAEQEKIVFFVGRMVKEKGVHILLQSIPGILSQCPDAKFVLAGKGPMLQELQAQAAELGISHKTLFLGFITDEEKNRLLHIASAAVFPSLYEPFGIVALEAMAAGTPVVVSGVGGLSEVVSHEEDGYTVLPGDIPSLTTHIVKLLKNPQEAASMAERAKRKAADVYNWSRIAERTADTYRQMLEEAEIQHDRSEISV